MKGIVMRWHLVAQAVRRPYNIVVKRNQKKIRQLINSCGIDDACLVQSCFNRRCLRSSSQLMFPEVGRVATTELRKFVKETRASMVVATRGIDILMSMVNAKKPILTVRRAQRRVSRNASRTCNPRVCATESLYALSLLLVLLFECCNLAKAHREDGRRPHIRIEDGSPFLQGFQAMLQRFCDHESGQSRGPKMSKDTWLSGDELPCHDMSTSDWLEPDLIPSIEQAMSSSSICVQTKLDHSNPT